MKTRVIHTKIHKDPYVHGLSDKEYRVFVFILTNDAINMCGVYELNDAEIKLWCKVGEKKLTEIKEKFTTDRKILFKDGWVIVVNHNKYNSYGNGDFQLKALIREIDLIPNHIKEYLNTSIDTSSTLGLIQIQNNKLKTKTKTINQKEEKEKGTDEENRDIIARLTRRN